LTDRWTHHRRSSDLNTGIRESQLDAYLNRVLKQPRLFASFRRVANLFRLPLSKRHSDGDVGFLTIYVCLSPTSGRAGTVAFSSLLTLFGL